MNVEDLLRLIFNRYGPAYTQPNTLPPTAERLLIRVKHIYNFLLIHASFVMLSHVSTILLHHFHAFCRTNLLTRCLIATDEELGGAPSEGVGVASISFFPR